MAEYIERESLLTDIMNRYCMECDNANGTRCLACWVEDMNGEIVNAPAADVVEVVRCKDCIHYKPQKQSAHWSNSVPYCCRVTTVKVTPNSFCSYGERRSDDG